MLSKRIIACLDVRDGCVVKGVNFEGLRNAGDPAELATRYNREGIDEVVILDVTATIEKRKALADTINAVAREVFLPLCVGGGIRDESHAAAAIDAGADKVSVNTAAVKRPELVAEISREFGAQCCVVAIDGRRSEDAKSGFEVYTHGGRIRTGIDAVVWAKEVARLGAGEILLTSMDRDGTKDGFDLSLTRAVSDSVPIPVIASGGVGTLDHLVEGVTEGHADAVLAASIFHFGEYTVAEAKQRMLAAGVRVRPPE